jgi:hypothetical protein
LGLELAQGRPQLLQLLAVAVKHFPELVEAGLQPPGLALCRCNHLVLGGQLLLQRGQLLLLAGLLLCQLFLNICQLLL